jgi:hypothetical protein
MLGYFQGQEYVRVYRSGSSWWLAGRSDQGLTYGYARCVLEYTFGVAR